MFAVLEKLSQIDKGFTYNIAFDNNNIATGVVWMTSTMRSNLMKFGSFICLDAMKRTTNVHAWPYIGPTIVNDINHISVVCESYCVSERIDAYKFILKSLFQMAPQFDKTVVKVIFADEFLNQTTLDDVGMSQTRLIYDHYHLHLNWLKSIGPLYTMVYRPMFTQILNADSENKFNFLVQEARNEYKDNATVLKELNDLVMKKNHCVSYVIDSIEGSCGKRGSTHAEQNHASIMAILGKDFVGQLEDLLKILLERQERLNKQYNTELSEAYHDMLMKHQSLMNANKDQILIDASKHLSKWSYDRFEKAYKASSQYTVESLEDDSYNVYRSKNQIKPPRHFINLDTKCNCVSSIAFQEQCSHEIKLLKKFDLNRFSKRHLIRSGNTMNKNIMGYTNPHCYSHIKIDGFRCGTIGIYEDELLNNKGTLCSVLQKNNPSQSTLVIASNNNNDTIDLLTEDLSLSCNNAMKPINAKNHLSHKEAQDIVSKLYNACQRNPQLHVVIGGFLLQMLNVVQNNDITKITSIDDMQFEFTKLINNFNSSFNTIDMFQTPNDISIGFRNPIPDVSKSIKKRLQPMVEKSSKRHCSSNTNLPISFRRVHKKVKSCSFCSETGHTISSCPTKKLLGDEVDSEQLIYDMEMSTPFSIASKDDKIIYDFNWKDVYHISITSLISKVNPGTDRPHPCKFICNIRCYDKIACLIPGYDNILVPMTDVIKHIRAVKQHKTKRVFSKLNTCVGSQFQDFERIVPIYSLSQQMIDCNKNQSQEVKDCIKNKSTSQQKKMKASPQIAELIYSSGEDDEEYFSADKDNNYNTLSITEEIENEFI